MHKQILIHLLGLAAAITCVAQTNSHSDRTGSGRNAIDDPHVYWTIHVWATRPSSRMATAISVLAGYRLPVRSSV